MAWTKSNFYIGIIFVVLVFFTSMAIIGTDIGNSNRISVNDKSTDYILELKGVSTDSGYEGVADTDSGDSQSKGLLDSKDNKSVISGIDFLATLQIKKERMSEPTNFFQLVYNIPTSIIIALGMPANDFRHIINILGVILFIALLITIWRIIRP